MNSSTSCNFGNSCVMYGINNPITLELGIENLFLCSVCFRVHVCDMQHDCTIINTNDGAVCTKTSLSYNEIAPIYFVNNTEPIGEPDVENVNVVILILSYAYSYLVDHMDMYSEIFKKITKDGKFIKKIENGIFHTFNAIFTPSLIHKMPLSTICQLFIQLIIGGHSNNTVYDANIIKVSRRKKEDCILKRMRLEYISHISK
ncbi:hypothetical protein MRV_0081 [Murid herpesvirus 3]|uniref:Uncharacterized protein n=2 Tax=Murid betaherpesvirus 3 TaxID=2560603 RepID=A0A1P8VIY2_9BETA|nr:hypothetical protein MRV_0081 [Murine roseolovirus]APZ76292.1 hypothetical protein MRV_0081 [Murid betaherpesvirus 3]AYH64789.1 hypothetical protein MRV_0081 [Murid herpesvirus 3]